MFSLRNYLLNWNNFSIGRCGEWEGKGKVLCNRGSCWVGFSLLSDQLHRGSIQPEILVWSKLPTSPTLSFRTSKCRPRQQYLMFIPLLTLTILNLLQLVFLESLGKKYDNFVLFWIPLKTMRKWFVLLIQALTHRIKTLHILFDLIFGLSKKMYELSGFYCLLKVKKSIWKMMNKGEQVQGNLFIEWYVSA